MKIIVVGASGTLGKAIVNELGARHDIIPVGRSSGDYQVDMTDFASVKSLFDRVGPVDAVVSAAGGAHFGLLADATPEQMFVGLKDKLMGQVNLVLAGQHKLNDGGSFTLISGVLTYNPIVYGSNLSMVNGALEAFARAAAIELPRGLRINVVSPTVLQESMEGYGPYFRGFEAVPAARAALAYSRSVEGRETGKVYSVL